MESHDVQKLSWVILNVLLRFFLHSGKVVNGLFNSSRSMVTAGFLFHHSMFNEDKGTVFSPKIRHSRNSSL